MNSTTTSHARHQVNHILVDFENVRKINPSLIGSQSVHFTLLLGSCDKKLDVEVVEKLWEHAASVQLVRLTSAGKNALDFALAYYLGRAVLADPTGSFHIVSKDKGYDALIEHLRSKHIHVCRHDDFTALTFSASPKPAPTSPPPPAESVVKVSAKPSARSAPKAPAPPTKPVTEKVYLEMLEARVLMHLRKLSTKRPGTKGKLISYLGSHLGKNVVEADVLKLVEMMSQAGQFVIDDKGKVTYHMDLA